MRISLDWLRDYVEVDIDPEELAVRLTRAGLETESIESVGSDTVIELETTSNRPDHLSHFGVAREVAWICGVSLRSPGSDFTGVPEVEGRSITEWVSLDVQDAERCPLYSARLAVDVEVGPSPEIVRRRLQAIGLRSINNVVDLSNYVLMEFGQPLHAFDYDRIDSGVIQVRCAAQGERIVAINERAYDLEREDLVIADRSRAMAIAGIMGGVETEVSESTQRVLVESAYFAAVPIRRTARRLALTSDSSYRFERKVDPRAVERASARYCALLQQHCGARILEGASRVVREGFLEGAEGEVSLRPARATHVLGVEIPPEDARESLLALGFEPIGGDEENQRYRCPSFRVDVEREIDLIEEVARVHGFDDIPESTLSVFPVEESDREISEERIRTWMVAAGFHEALTFSFLEGKDDPEIESWWCSGEPFEVRNPVRSEERFLRRSLLPNLLKAVRLNRNGGVDRVRLFELSRVFHRNGAGEGRPRERTHLAWVIAEEGADYRRTRGIADGIAMHLQEPALSWSPESAIPAMVGHAASVHRDGARLALVGALEIPDVKGLVWCGEVAVDSWLDAENRGRTYRPFSRFPAVQRDVNMVMDDAILWSAVEEHLSSLDLADLQAITFTDLYRGKQVPAGKKSVTFSMVFQSADRTLTHTEVDELTSRAVEALRERFDATLRS